MKRLQEIGKEVSAYRKQRGLRQLDLAAMAGLSRATLDALENGRSTDIGFSKLTRLLAVLGLELVLRPATSDRPTLDELLREDSDD